MIGLGLGIGIGGGGGASGPASPLNILPDVCCWLRSDSWTVSSFPDKSGKGNTFTQATGANQPTINASDANFGGQPSATFNGTSTFLSLASFTPGSGTDAFYWYVMQLTSASSFPVWWGEAAGAGDSNHEFRGNSGTGEPMLNCGTIAVTVSWASTIVGATKAVYAFDNHTGTIGVSVSNGVAVTNTKTAGPSIVSTPVCLGARSPGTSLWTPMTLAEVVVCTTMPSGPQLSALQAYGVARYGAI